MEEGKWTPGPWTACFAHDGHGQIFAWHITGELHGSTHPICGLRSVSPEMRSHEEDRANATLIAAAPEQHEALAMVAGKLPIMPDPDAGPDEEIEIALTWREVSQIKHALSRALGRENGPPQADGDKGSDL